MVPISGRQPWYVPLILWGAPLAVAASLFWINFSSFRSYGRQSSDMKDWVIEAILVLLVAVPLFFPLRKIILTSSEITAYHYAGPRVSLAWADVVRIEIFQVESSGLTKTSVKVSPRRGRKMVFNSQLSNFDDLVAAVRKHASVPIIQHPTRPTVGIYRL